MATEIYIVSGFLGAGKTTLIQKLLREAFQGEKIALIENDFGEISVDAALLKSGSVQVKELNSGCICCSLAGDFGKAIEELVCRFQPDKIVIEPSGVGKLSDIMKACSAPRLLALAEVQAKITVADVKRCQMYLDNFGEFFADQIRYADAVVLSRTEDYPQGIAAAQELIGSINPHAAILAKPWEQIAAGEIISRQPASGHLCHHGCGCGHHQTAEEAFETVTVRTKRTFSKDELKARAEKMARSANGTILRAKGIVRGPDGYLNFQYLPGDVLVTDCASPGELLCFIGRNLNSQELVNLFSGA